MFPLPALGHFPALAGGVGLPVPVLLVLVPQVMVVVAVLLRPENLATEGAEGTPQLQHCPDCTVPGELCTVLIFQVVSGPPPALHCTGIHHHLYSSFLKLSPELVESFYHDFIQKRMNYFIQQFVGPFF